MDLPGDPSQGTAHKYYQGADYTVLRSLQVFKLFEDVFGSSNTGIDKRLVRTLCSGGNEGLSSAAIRNIIYDGTVTTDYSAIPLNKKYNPHKQRPDVYSLAPYAGSELNGIQLDGAAVDVVTNFRLSLAKTEAHFERFNNLVMSRYHFPLVAYEGGQHLLINAGEFGKNPAIYQEYIAYMDTWKKKGFLMFVHYTLYGGGDKRSWGAKINANSSLKESHKFRALVDWDARDAL